MRRHEALIPYSRFHRDILFLALIAKKKGPAIKGYPTKLDDKVAYVLTFYSEKLQPHFEQEEKEIYAVVAGLDADLDELIATIRSERLLIDEQLEQLKTTATPAEVLDQLGHLLEKHVRKEERQLFQKIQAVCSEATLSKIGE